MPHCRTCFLSLCIGPVLLLAAALPAYAVPRDPNGGQPDCERPCAQESDEVAGDRRHRGRGRAGAPLGDFQRLFPPLASDQAPLTDEERDELHALLDREFPTLGRMLRRLQWRDPERFERRMQDVAPRLRQLRRIFDEDVELGRAVVAHAQVSRALREAQRAWHDADLQPQRRAQLAIEMREQLAKSVRIEARVLEIYLQQAEAQRPARVTQRLDWMLGRDADRALFPPELRTLLEQASSAADAAERDVAYASLRNRIAERLETRDAALAARLQELRDDPERVVDQRLETLQTEPPAERGRGWGGHRGRRGLGS